MESLIWPNLLERRIVHKIKPFVYIGFIVWAMWMYQMIIGVAYLAGMVIITL